MTKDTPQTEKEEIETIAIFDGKYADNLVLIQFEEAFNWLMEEAKINKTAGETELVVSANLTFKAANVFIFRKWEITGRKKCMLEVKYHRETFSNDTYKYQMRIKDSALTKDEMCLEQDQVITIETKSLDAQFEIDFSQRVQNFSTAAIIIMLILMYNYEDELKHYEIVYTNRFYAPETHGQQAVTYVSKFSFVTSGIFFVTNFTIFMFYF